MNTIPYNIDLIWLNPENILLLLLEKWVKNEVSDLLNTTDIRVLVNNLNKLFSLDYDLELYFSEIKDTCFDNLKVCKSKIDSKYYLVNNSLNNYLDLWFVEIIEVIEFNWRIVFQAKDEFIDWYYSYYDYNSWKIISKKNYKRYNSINDATLI